MELFERRFGRVGLEGDGHDGRLGSEILEMRVQHPEKNFDVVGRLGDFEPVRVTAFVAKNNLETQIAHHEMKPAEPHGKLLEKPAKHEEERLARLDFIFELERFLERFPDRHELEEPRGFPRRAIPQLHPDWPQPRGDCFFFQGRELT